MCWQPYGHVCTKRVDGRMTIQELSTATWESEREWVADT